MKRVISFIIAVLMLCLFSVSVFAYEIVNDTWVENGDTYLGVFKVKGTEYEDFFKRWKTSDKNILFINPEGSVTYYDFVILSGNVNMSLDFAELPGKVKFVFSGTGEVEDLLFCSDDTGINVKSYGDFLLTEHPFVYSYCKTAVGTYFDTINYVFPSEYAPFLPECEGNLIIVDDIDDDDGGILDWIGGFFTNLWDFFVKLIVPDAEYFSNWFEEIKNAAMEKLGPVGDIFGALGDLFGSLENDTTSSSLILDIPRNHFFQGFDGVRVDLLESGKDIIAVVKGFLTACMVLLTCIVCYKRVIVLFEGDV